MLNMLTAVPAFAILALVIAAADLMPAGAQEVLGSRPGLVSTVDGAQSVQVTVSWQSTSDCQIAGFSLYCAPQCH